MNADLDQAVENASQTVNLYALRATRPEKLLDVVDPTGPQNHYETKELAWTNRS